MTLDDLKVKRRELDILEWQFLKKEIDQMITAEIPINPKIIERYNALSRLLKGVPNGLAQK